MKKAGIIIDNYKVEKYQNELSKAGFTEVKTAKYKGDLTVITITAPDDKLKAIGDLCVSLEKYFKTLPNLN